MIQNKKYEPDYRAFYIMGIIWLPFGIIFKTMNFFFIMSLVFIALGLVNKDKWRKKPKKLDKKQATIGIILGLITFVIGVAVYFLR